MKLLLYCTKAKPYLIQGLAKPMHTLDTTNPFNYNWRLVNKGFSNDRLNGKIVAECDFEVEKLSIGYGVGWQTETIKGTENIEKLSCLSRAKLYEYCKGNGYAIHIKNLHIFDEPRELSEYDTYTKGGTMVTYPYSTKIRKAPQNMMYATQHLGEPMYVENHYIGLDDYFEDYILISIRPEWLCKILNGEKTIEVRRKVLKEMLK